MTNSLVNQNMPTLMIDAVQGVNSKFDGH